MQFASVENVQRIGKCYVADPCRQDRIEIMAFQFNNENSGCRSVEPLLADYLENALSARTSWEVEKHLTACRTCTQVFEQMQATVQILHSADRYDTGDDFMAKLHARLDEVEPMRDTAQNSLGARQGMDILRLRGRSIRDRAQSGLVSLRSAMRSWHLPALATGLAAATLILVVHGNMPVTPTKVIPPIVSLHTAPSEDLSRQVALVASNPFDDPVAAKAEVDGASGENHNENNGATANF